MRLLRNELFRLRRRWMPWLMLAMVVGIVIAYYGTTYASVTSILEGVRSGRVPPPQGGTAPMEAALRQLALSRVPDSGVGGIVAGLGTILVIVLAASVTGSEYAWGTLRVLLANGAGRARLHLAKLAVYAGFGVVLIAVGALTALVASAVVTAIGSLDPGPTDDLAARIAVAGARSAFTYLPYVALAALVAVVARSSGGAIAIALVVFFAEGLVAGLLVALNPDLAGLANAGLSRNAAAIYRLNQPPTTAPAGAGSQTMPDAGTAALILTTYAVLFTAVALVVLRRRDVTLG